MARRRPLPSDAPIEVWENGGWHEEPIDELTRRLATHPPGPGPVLSLYLDTHWRDEQQRERTWLSVRERARALAAQFPDDGLSAAERKRDSVRALLDAALEFAEERVRQRADVGYAGVALFSGAGLKLAVRSRTPLPTLLTLAPLPIVRPLVATASGHERALLALADAEGVRVLEVATGRARDLAELVGDTPNRQSQGGFSQLKFQHWRAERMREVHREAAALLTKLFDAGKPERVVVGGPPEARGELLRALEPRLRERALTVEELGRHDPLRRVLERVAPRLEEDERRVQAAQVEAIMGAARSRAAGSARAGARGAAGLPEVMRALDEARVARLLVADRPDGTLALCSACQALTDARRGSERAETCALCGGLPIELDAGEALVRAAIALGAEVSLVPPELIAPHRAIAALRW